MTQYLPPPLSSSALCLLLSAATPSSEPTPERTVFSPVDNSLFPDMSASHIIPSHTGRTQPVPIPRKPRSISPRAPLSAPASLSSLTGPEDDWESDSDTDDDDDIAFASDLELDLNAEESDEEDEEEEEDSDVDVAALYLVPTPAVAHTRSQPVDIPPRPKRESTLEQTPYVSSRSFGGNMFASDPYGNVRGRNGVWFAPDGGIVPGKPEQARSLERYREMIMRQVVW